MTRAVMPVTGVVTRLVLVMPWRQKARWWRWRIDHMGWWCIDDVRWWRMVDHPRWWWGRRHIHGDARYINAHGDADIAGMHLGTRQGCQQAHGSQAARGKASTESGLVHVSVSFSNYVWLS